MTERNVIFGEAVEQYEPARPGYPEELVSDVLEFAGAGPALEVGAGSGKASVEIAAVVGDGAELPIVPDLALARRALS